jgi:23S rRNA pseudouridine1911/1915/1917 synthase
MDQLRRTAVAPPEMAGARFDQIAAAVFPDFSRSRLKEWIDAGALTVDGEQAAPKTRLRGGEQLALDAILSPEVPVAPEDIPLDCVYEDESLLVIDKPAGLVVHPGAGNPSGTLQNALLARDSSLALVPRAGIVHRLDKDTSGLLVVARNLTAQQRLAQMIENRDIHRVYLAVCQRVLTAGGRVDAPIDRHPRDRTRMAVREGGREAHTLYRVVERFRAQTLVEVTLETGRTHQIRVHMAHIRAPLVGDPAYGGRPRLPPAPAAELVVQLRGFGRQALHAARLAFAHPATGAPLEFSSPLPADFEALLSALRQDRDGAAESARDSGARR